MLKKLIGSQILEVGGNYINIKKDNEKFRLEIISDDGDCCGFSDFETKLLYEPQDLRNPIIT